MFQFFRKRTHRKYSLPFGWKITFPIDWEHESYDDQDVFYPKDSDLTVRISPLHVTNAAGELAPIEVLDPSKSPLKEEAKLLYGFNQKTSDYLMFAYEDIITEDGEPLHHFHIQCTAPGDTLIISVFSEARSECCRVLPFIKMIKKRR